MPTVIKIVGLWSGQPHRCDDSYLARWDRRPCRGWLHLARSRGSRTQALTFPSSVEAWEFWKQVDPRHPTRPDGQPNRPLTAFTVTLETLA